MNTPIPSPIRDLFEQPSFGTLFALPADDASQTGAGTAANPIRIARNGFDDLLRKMNRGTWHRLHLGPGQFYTKGCWAFRDTDYASMARPFHLSGEGAKVTSIGLSESPVSITDGRRRPDVSVLWCGSPSEGVFGAKISGIEIDGHADLFDMGCKPIAGVVMYGAGNAVQDLRIRGLQGDAANQLEAFGVLLNSAPVDAPYWGGSSIERVDVFNEVKESDYFTGIYAGQVSGAQPKPLAPTIVSGCRVVSRVPGQTMAYAFNQRATFRDCFASGVRYAFYNDTDTVEDVIIDGAVAEGLTYAALNVVAVNDAVKRGVTMVGSTFRFQGDPGQAWIGICLWDKSGESKEFSDFLVENCRFIGRDDAIPMTAVSVAGGTVRNVRLVTNSWPKNSVMNLQGVPKTAIVLTANRDLDGANLLQFGTPPIAKK